MDDFKLLTTKEVASLLGKHVQTVRQWRREGRLPEPLIDSRNPAWSWYQIRRWIELDDTRCVDSEGS
jgi:predicted DNA-binding transcriptional regulator AlpA